MTLLKYECAKLSDRLNRFLFFVQNLTLWERLSLLNFMQNSIKFEYSKALILFSRDSWTELILFSHFTLVTQPVKNVFYATLNTEASCKLKDKQNNNTSVTFSNKANLVQRKTMLLNILLAGEILLSVTNISLGLTIV